MVSKLWLERGRLTQTCENRFGQAITRDITILSDCLKGITIRAGTEVEDAGDEEMEQDNEDKDEEKPWQKSDDEGGDSDCMSDVEMGMKCLSFRSGFETHAIQ